MAFAAKLCGFCCETFAVIALRLLLLLWNFAASVVKLLRWLRYDIRLLLLLWNFAACVVKLLRWLRDDCCFCCKTLQLLLWNFCGDCVTTYDCCVCCETLQLLLWNFCGDCVTTVAFAVKLCSFCCETFAVIALRRTTVAFAVKLCSFCCETFAVIALRRTTVAFAVKLCSFCCETFAVIALRLLLLLWNFAASVVKLLRWLRDDLLLLWNFCGDCVTTVAFAVKLCSFCCETFAVIAWRHTTLAFATMKNVAKKMLLFDVELMSTFKKVFLANFNSKRLWLAKNWCTQLLAGKLEKLSLSWLALSTFCYFKLCWLVNRHHRYGWLGFLFLNCLARWQWRAGIFFSQERWILTKIDVRTHSWC